MPDVIHGSERHALVRDRSLLDEAGDLPLRVAASCRRAGRCHECVVEIRAGADQLSSRTAAEAFLAERFRLACQARIARTDHDVEFTVLRRRLRIELAPPGDVRALDPTVRVVAGRVRGDDDADLGPWRGSLLGLAVDVGTTTIVAELVDLATGGTAALAAFENPQRFGGSDVISRIAYESDHPGELRRALRRALNREVRHACELVGADRRTIVEAMVVGNTTMRDLFFGLDVAPIGRRPYRSVTEPVVRGDRSPSTAVVRLAHELGLWMHPQGRVVGGPLIASHVGADAAADLVACLDETQPGPFLLVDIGTNTEVIVGDGRRMLAASSPAGPAFEGGGVSHGMPGADGAIEAVRLDPDGFAVRTIGDTTPEGICGSGLVDLLSELRRTGRMTGRGRFADGSAEVQVVPSSRVSLTSADVAHLAVAKAATAVGQLVLLRRLGLAASDLRRVHLAGGFGNGLSAEAAMRIGLLVRVPPERVVRAGNASMAGAKALLLSRRARTDLEHLVRRIEHVELEREPDFFHLFASGCTFEEIAA